MKRILIAAVMTGMACGASGAEIDFDRGAWAGDFIGQASRLETVTVHPAMPALINPLVGEKAASIVPVWFDISRLSFVLVLNNDEGFSAILRSGGFLTTTKEMLVFIPYDGKAIVIFTDYSTNPMAAPKNKAEVYINNTTSRKETAAILRQVRKNKPVNSGMAAALDGLLGILDSGSHQKSTSASYCAAGFENMLTCFSDPKPGDNAIVAGIAEAINVCVKGKSVTLALSAEGETQEARVDKVVPRAGGVEYTVNEPKFNFIVTSGTAPGVPRRATLQLFLGAVPVESSYRCVK